MIKIGNHFFEKKENKEESLREIKQYLRQERIVLTGVNDIPLTDDEIREHLLNQDIEFGFKTIDGLEVETMYEAIQYIEHAEVRIKELMESTEQAVIFKSFIDLIEALTYLERLTSRLSSGIISIEKINSFGDKAVLQMEKGNTSYLLDVMEYECLPLLLQTKEFLQQWKIN